MVIWAQLFQKCNLKWSGFGNPMFRYTGSCNPDYFRCGFSAILDQFTLIQIHIFQDHKTWITSAFNDTISHWRLLSVKTTCGRIVIGVNQSVFISRNRKKNNRNLLVYIYIYRYLDSCLKDLFSGTQSSYNTESQIST